MELGCFDKLHTRLGSHEESILLVYTKEQKNTRNDAILHAKSFRNNAIFPKSRSVEIAMS